MVFNRVSKVIRQLPWFWFYYNCSIVLVLLYSVGHIMMGRQTDNKPAIITVYFRYSRVANNFSSLDFTQFVSRKLC